MSRVNNLRFSGFITNSSYLQNRWFDAHMKLIYMLDASPIWIQLYLKFNNAYAWIKKFPFLHICRWLQSQVPAGPDKPTKLSTSLQKEVVRITKRQRQHKSIVPIWDSMQTTYHPRHAVHLTSNHITKHAYMHFYLVGQSQIFNQTFRSCN